METPLICCSFYRLFCVSKFGWNRQGFNWFRELSWKNNICNKSIIFEFVWQCMSSHKILMFLWFSSEEINFLGSQNWYQQILCETKCVFLPVIFCLNTSTLIAFLYINMQLGPTFFSFIHIVYFTLLFLISRFKLIICTHNLINHEFKSYMSAK